MSFPPNELVALHRHPKIADDPAPDPHPAGVRSPLPDAQCRAIWATDIQAGFSSAATQVSVVVVRYSRRHLKIRLAFISCVAPVAVIMLGDATFLPIKFNRIRHEFQL